MKTLKKVTCSVALQFVLGLCFTFSFADKNIVMVNLPIQFSGISEGAIAWNWDFGDGQLVSGIENPVHIFTAPGTYSVVLTTSNVKCEGQQEQIIEVVAKAHVETEVDLNEAEIRIFPNPTTENISLTINNYHELQYEVIITDLSGKMVLNESVAAMNGTLLDKVSVMDLSTGIYLVEIKGKSESFSTRFIKK